MTWPYGPPPEPFLESPGPSWLCPDDLCQCRPIKMGGELDEVNIVLLAADGARMPGAACQVHYQGRVMQDAEKADGDGRVKVKLPRVPTTLLIEWAPEDTPQDPRYPYRALYYVDLARDQTETGRRRLANLGFWTERTLEDNVREFQRCYDETNITGELRDITPRLTLYHDHGCPPVIKQSSKPPTVAQSGGEAAAFSPQDAQASGGDVKTPQTPLGPAPKQGSVKVASIEVDVIIEWGVRPARAGKGEQTSTSFMLNPTASPVAIGVLSSSSDGWPTRSTTTIPITRRSKTSVSARLPVGPLILRIDFDLQVTVGSSTKSVLAFRQSYLLQGNGDLVPLRFAFAEYTYQKGSGTSPPTRAAGNGYRRGRDLHPLLWHETDLFPLDLKKAAPGKPKVERRTKRIFVNCEMVDATDLWWAVHPQEDVPQYLNPALKGRPEFMRVLCWTSGKLPLIWFAIVPDAALTNTERPAADIVFVRPPPGANSFAYTADAKGFSNTQHTSTTMQILARYALGSQPLATLQAAGVSEVHTLRAFADQIQPNSLQSQGAGTVSPTNPVPYISMFPTAFRPCWLEDSMNRAGAPNVLLLPLGAGENGYPGVTTETGLKTAVESAFLCLWNQCAVARDIPATDSLLAVDGADVVQKPSVQARSFWLVGHSSGNGLMGAALAHNGADVDRVLSFSPTPASSNLATLIGNIRLAATARTSAGKAKLDVFMITAPDMKGATQWDGLKVDTTVNPHVATDARGTSMDVANAKKLIATGASVTFLPPFADQRAHYTLAPVASMRPFLRDLLRPWSDNQIATGAANPHAWQFLFFHEYPVFGGDLDSTATPATLRPFFLQALGTPQPLTTPPTTIPP